MFACLSFFSCCCGTLNWSNWRETGLILFTSWFKVLVNGKWKQAGSSWVDHILSREAKKDEPGNGATRGGQVLPPPIMAIKIILFHRLIVQVLLDFNQVGSYFVYSPICWGEHRVVAFGGGGRERSSYCKSDLTLDLQLPGFLRAWCAVFRSLASCSILSGGGDGRS